ncbi:Hypothetical protein RMHFA_00228 [Roseomonas mucosa]|uniref:hypothetical protein n=1 Tax=Roseomonas TaxID=125216 RepID=UPI0009624310|nr:MULTISPECIES: hypothetical protein [Roseomonas]ATR22317.1 hypothetical protein CTJ15_19725 [Roseomonas sp. FDAARGOS_362]UZO95153.1 Hypothetical protein RMHFA_00228 [Roseomonas mucosa]GAV33080.1 hypothetical protein ROTAS13_00731 [Roseomonas sp. TAS13]
MKPETPPPENLPGETSGSPPLAEFSFLFSPVRHAANNLAMVLLMNLESAARVIPPTERGSRQIARALEAAEEYDRLMRSLLALTRSEQEVPLRASAYLQDLLPLLGLAAGRKLTLEAEGEPAELRVRRPALDAALLALMQDMPAGSPPVLRLRGTRLTPGFPVDAARQDALRAAGVTVEGSVLQLPTRAG